MAHFLFGGYSFTHDFEWDLEILATFYASFLIDVAG